MQRVKASNPFESPRKCSPEIASNLCGGSPRWMARQPASIATINPVQQSLESETKGDDGLLQYVDLDEFLSENGIPVDGVAGGGQGTMQSGQLHKMNNTEAPGHQGPAGLHLEPITKRERSPSPSECCSPDTMNPPSPADSSKPSYTLRSNSDLLNSRVSQLALRETNFRVPRKVIL